MRRRITVRALLAAISIAVIVSCQGVTEPVTAGTAFVLESVGGAPVPAVAGTIPSGAVLIADTLVFLSRDDRASGQVEHHETAQLGPSVSHASYARLYNWHDGVLTFSPAPCPPGALCAHVEVQPPSETGRFGPRALTITYGSPGIFPRTYRRVN
ncbi:MAG TPA: hypothetical protein VGH98_15910 [Gemmatimonadaceae bacterium]|jgi:hypothetical protein